MANGVNGWIASLHCPTRAEMIAAAVALLPRGRAWQTNEGGPDRGVVGGFQMNAFQNNAFATESRTPSVLWQFWSAVGEVMHYVAARFCALRLEFWCATKVETTDLWMEEYGLPDACDPFPDLCAKVAAIGGTRCEYYAEIAARAGWSISCDEIVRCGAKVGSRFAKTGCMMTGVSRPTLQMVVTVYLNESPAYKSSGLRRRRARTGCFQTGRRLTCDFFPIELEIAPLECLMARVVHAEIPIKYEAA